MLFQILKITYIVNGADINLSIWEGPYNLESSLCFGLLSKFIRLSSRSSRVFSFSNWILAPGITEKASVDSDLTVLMPLSCCDADIGSSSYELLRPCTVLLAIRFRCEFILLLRIDKLKVCAISICMPPLCMPLLFS